ncbi:MAG: sulfate adenylyltransferase subunit CysN [Paludibacterium sp.]|uniref:sulfate adenylyltransferase subunit CysN n=1 Tax=Paludibacterium sp. TaxID=1917523 RepID=UPI0025F8BE14|nr:sulfate adenylyltransferase subunit CysN [Paludibacterium sp.]MBV8046953.1 sulfate adenylyltransferase subunit CysN [Paludibacterium sp.]MBV8648417.1 sulfate adenylyltransferase subunit CysN [Paludibacterium sp.]
MSHQSELIAENIHEYLKQHEQKDLLRFITCGSVDDGKSTLIGRLLHDSKLIFEDQLAAIQRDSQRYNTTDDDIDLALLVDGLQAEREQGITIDVAYRYFSTEKRKFIIADCPGHEQYTRNMATGASTCDLAVILVDARHGIQTQTRRHSYIVSLLGVRHVIVAVNKMDLLGYDAKAFDAIREQYRQLVAGMDFSSLHFVPISALRGDNVVEASKRMPWYQGETLMQLLETVDCDTTQGLAAFRLPVQWVNRPHADFRGFSGTVASGDVHPGDVVRVLPSGRESRVKAIVTADGDLARAHTGQAITLTLADEIDISRGDMLVRADQTAPQVSASFDAHVVWMADAPLAPGREYLFKLAGRQVPGRVERILHRIDVNTHEVAPAEQLALNEIGLCRIRLDAPVVFDPYRLCRHTGNFIIIDRFSHATSAGGMIAAAADADGGAERASARFDAFAADLSAVIAKHYPGAGIVDLPDLLARRGER